ncbi:hypothetical protein [Kitasatospora sp. LaBMicrA B282]|uniref:hypothetical protein n=1 Tax=Kitasatospora sp. LaBMicrA B282 TaxID=3420949 RepID=UPI003D147F8F
MIRSTLRPRSRRLLVAAVTGLLTLAPLGTAGAAAPSRSKLEVFEVNSTPVRAGERTELHTVIGNDGPEPTANPITVDIELPLGSYAAEPFFPTDCRPGMGGHSVSCQFPAGLRDGRTATVLIPVVVENGTPPGELTDGKVTVTSVDDPAVAPWQFGITVI